MKITIQHNNEIIAANVVIAKDFWTRLSGYMFRKSPHVSGILFEPAGTIQTSFMCFDLDLFFLSQDNRVLKIVRQLKPWRLSTSSAGSRKVLELPTGVAPSSVTVGDILEIVPGN